MRKGRRAKGFGPRKKVLTPPALRPHQDRGVLPVTRDKFGRDVTAYDEEMALEIVQLISEGWTLREVGRPGSGYVAPATFRRWCAEHPELMKQFKLAQEVSAYAMDEEALDKSRQLHDNPLSKEHIAATRVLNEQLRWSAARRNPHAFGDKTQVNTAVPIQINTTLDLGQGGAGAPKAAPSVYDLTAVVDALPAGELTEDPAVPTYTPIPQQEAPHASQQEVPGRKLGAVRGETRDEGPSPDEGQRQGEG